MCMTGIPNASTTAVDAVFLQFPSRTTCISHVFPHHPCTPGLHSMLLHHSDKQTITGICTGMHHQRADAALDTLRPLKLRLFDKLHRSCMHACSAFMPPQSCHFSTSMHTVVNARPAAIAQQHAEERTSLWCMFLKTSSWTAPAVPLLALEVTRQVTAAQHPLVHQWAGTGTASPLHRSHPSLSVSTDGVRPPLNYKACYWP